MTMMGFEYHLRFPSERDATPAEWETIVGIVERFGLECAGTVDRLFITARDLTDVTPQSTIRNDLFRAFAEASVAGQPLSKILGHGYGAIESISDWGNRG